MKVNISRLYRNLNKRIKETGTMESTVDGHISLKMLRFSLVSGCVEVVLLTAILVVLILNG